MDYSWPGNVREFKNVIERLTLSCHCNPIVPDCLPIEIQHPKVSLSFSTSASDEPGSLDETVAEFEKNIISNVFTKTGGNKAKAAALLGVPTSTLKSKMKKYGIQ